MRILTAGLLLSLCIPALVACSEPDVAQVHVGYVETEWRYIAAPGSGWLRNRPVLEGDSIEVGDPLFELDSDLEIVALREATSRINQATFEAENLDTGARPAEIDVLKARLAEANARVTRAKAERDRVLPLVKRGLEPDSRRDQVIADYDVAVAARNVAQENIKVAELAARTARRRAAAAGIQTSETQRESAEVSLSRRAVTATFGGTVTEVFHYPGEFVTTGTPVLAIAPPDSLKVRFYVTQRELTDFALGKKITARADGLPASVEATVSYISTTAEFTPPVIYSKGAREKLVFMIEARLPANSGLLPGLPVDVDWT